MPVFNYKARDATGKLVKGTMEAVNKSDIVDRLNRIGYMVVYVSETEGGLSFESFLQKFKRASTYDMLLFYVQFSNMVNAGINILAILSALKKESENAFLREAIANIASSVEAGETLSKALAGQPAIFPRLFVNMVKAGEASGKLDSVLAKYAQFYEHQEDLRQKIANALIYPAILLCAGIAVTLFIVAFVIPQFAEIYMKSGMKLPLLTLLVFKIGTAIRHYWYIPLGCAILILIGVRYYLRTEKGILFFDRLKLKTPLIGLLHRKAIISRFARTLATLFESGVPILMSLEITRDVVGNEVVGRVIDSVHSSVEKGERMNETLKVSEEFPPDVVQMISVGEDTGKLDEMLNKIADFYDMAVGYAVKRLTTLIEPLFLVIMGVMVGLIMASMLLPIFDMIKTLRH